ncbi:phosphoenolpyruvate hydrolase family protein [Plantactinospora sp. GCM10030261]|uniref:phosphoenolpyruvate hydrolase family protein n=1 Tax=Plantactinospora sp. GCM10030261 TaxID=3273420 RepID=UPI003621E70D
MSGTSAARGTGHRLPRAPLAAAAGDPAHAARLAAAGVDVVVAYHSSVLRRRGLPSVAGLLPWANANDMTLGVLPRIAARVTDVPVFATVCANDALRPPEDVVADAAARGAAGVLNAPTVGLLSGRVRRAVESAGLGFRREVELMSLARASGLRAWGYAFTAGQARSLVAAGAEAIVIHLGITGVGQPVGRARRTRATVGTAARTIRPDVRLLLHGGPIHDPASFVSLAGDLDVGFLGASAFPDDPHLDVTVREWRAMGVGRPIRETTEGRAV